MRLISWVAVADMESTASVWTVEPGMVWRMFDL
jgi:hypothetical protein